MAHLPGRAFLRIFLSALAFSLAGRASASERTLTIETRDGPRPAIVVQEAVGVRPTLIYLHGAAMGAAMAVRTTAMKEEAAARGYAAVFPDGLGRVWNDGRNFRTGADDVGFLKALAARLVKEGVADPKRLYLSGISNGGFMTFRMMCEAPEAFAGFGAVIAGIGAETGAACRPARPMPLVMVAGTADPIVPYSGGGVGYFGRNGEVWSVERTAEFFADANGCKARRSTALPDGDATETWVTRIAWDCPKSAPVLLYRVEGGGHQAFGGSALPQLVFGKTTKQFSAARALFDMFDEIGRAAP